MSWQAKQALRVRAGQGQELSDHPSNFLFC